jgi:predicted Zn-ribbon and HTH transcriptional regulator
MPTIDFPCSNCGKKLSVKPEMAGKTGRCPACQTANVIPTPDGPPPISALNRPVVPSKAPLKNARCRCGFLFATDPGGVIDQAFRCPRCNATVGAPGSYLLYPDSIQRVHLVDAEMPFGSMCWLIFKWTFAGIPTAIVLFILFLIFSLFMRRL